jgi:hypothetical protein
MNETPKPKYSSLTSKKSYTTPEWWIGFMIFVKLIYLLVLFIALSRYQNSNGESADIDMSDVFMGQMINSGTTVILLLAEAITYWVIRRWIVKRVLVGIHIIGLLLTFVVIPFAFITYSTAFGNTSTEQTTGLSLRQVFIWTFFMVGHVGFVMVLIDACKKRKEKPESPAKDSPDILNDYA